MGNITEIMYMQKKNRECKIQKIDKDNYVLLETGEVKQFEHNENRADDMNNVRVSLGMLRDYLNTNITDVTHCRWVTLTYAENMTDSVKLQSDYRIFNKALRRKIGHYEYITAAEPQARGAWHLHVVMIFDKKAPFIPNKELAAVWKHGFVTVKKLDDVDNVGAYLTAYLGDMEFVEAWQNEVKVAVNSVIKDVEVIEKDGTKRIKKYIKGARLQFYPPGFNIYRCSRGIKKPVKEEMNNEKAEETVKNAVLTYETTIKLFDEEKDFENIINKRFYNKARKEKNERKNKDEST
jgi:hypothetical protein